MVSSHCKSDSTSRHTPWLDAPATLTELLADQSLNFDELLVTQIHRLLLDLIVSLKLRPGQLVSEKEVAEALQASKTPVREALIRLEDNGLVNIVPKSGSYVTPIRISAYIEGCFTRLQLESGAVRRAALRNDDEASLQRLDMIVEQQSEALMLEDHVRFFSLDQALHSAFFDMAGVAGVWHVLGRTQADVNRIRHLKRIGKIRRGPQVLHEHKRIVDEIRCGDADGAEQALVTHIGSLEKEIEQLAAHPELLAFIEQQDPGTTGKRTIARH
ncbi:MAG: GntR family transcriptional regulator [Granulosicoccus sp.]|nr:GntR family transcriptional regulator [Granulosicoccus sp.]